MNKENKLKYVEALDNLMGGVKKSYAGWGSDIDSLDEPTKSIRLKMIDEFNKGVHVKPGRKFDKVVTGTSVWGFVAKTNGKLKGIPYFVGDVFKAAGWRAPAKHVRGSIFSSKSDWYSWTGPNYLI
tara:strand:- start:479 stop:856 length:378 start_codon:yes stop_codon:yes gene_type:complete